MEKKNLLLGLPGTVVARQLKRFIRISRSFEALSTTFGIIFWNMRVIFSNHNKIANIWEVVNVENFSFSNSNSALLEVLLSLADYFVWLVLCVDRSI